MKSVRPPGRSKAAPLSVVAHPTVSGRLAAPSTPHLTTTSTTASSSSTATTTTTTGSHFAGARPKIPRATQLPTFGQHRTVDRPANRGAESALIKPSGTSVKRKLSSSTRPKTAQLGTVTPKRDRPDPDARSASREPKIPVKSRKIWGGAMPRAASKDSVSSSGSRENVPPGGVAAGVGQLQKEKHVLERRVTELARSADAKQAEVATLRTEIGKLREQQRAKSETVLLEVETLHAENRLLKDRLEELGAALSQGAPLSDSEKEFLLQKKCNSAPPSISGASNIMSYLTSKNELDADDYCSGGGMERALSDRGSLEWDKQSSSSVSEMSVACLQDRIMQMEETHYSTSEELQATLQELSDLQDQLMEVQNENERLSDEKAVLLESLYGKVRQLEDSRSQNDALKQLLLQRHAQSETEEGEDEQADTRDGDASATAALALTPAELEHRLLELIKIGEEDKRALLLKQEELARAGEEERADEHRQMEQLSDRNRVLQSSLDSVNADKRLLERQLSEVREAASGERIELGHLRSVLDNERAKVLELQQARQAQNQSELDKLLDAARKEKDRLEVKSTSLQEQLALSQCEAERLREQLSVLQEEAMVAKNNAKKHASDVEYRLAQATESRDSLHRQTLDLRESVNELERKCQRHLEDKRELRATISELQKTLNEASGRAESTQRQLDEARDKHRVESDEWQQFQQDLLMTVRVANDFKTEAQQETENLALETRQLRERITSLEAENERLKAMKTTTSPSFQRKPLQSTTTLQTSPFSSLPECVLGAVVAAEQDAAAAAAAAAGGVLLRPGSRVDSRLSVKSLIASLEGAATKPGVTLPGELIVSPTKVSPGSPTGGAKSILDKPLLTPILRRRDNELYIKPPSRPASSGDTSVLRDQKNPANATNIQPLRALQRNSYVDDMLGNNRAASLANNGSGGGGSNISSMVSGGNSNNGGGKQSSGTPDKVVGAPVGSGETYRSPASSVGSLTPVSILTNKLESGKRSSFGDGSDKKDALATLAKGGGSKRNALLKWCQNKTIGYKGIDITNFSSSWNDGLAFCAILHTYLPDLIPYDTLENKDKRRNFTVAFQAAEAVGIKTILNTGDMISMERPDWQSIMSYVTSIYRHFET